MTGCTSVAVFPWLHYRHRAHIGAGIKQRPDGRLRMITDQGPDFLTSGIDRLPTIKTHRDVGIVVLKVTVRCQGSQVHPLAHVGMTKKTVMILVRMTVNDRFLDLTTDSANRAN